MELKTDSIKYTSIGIESDLAQDIKQEAEKSKKTITAVIRSWKELAHAVRYGVN